MFQRLKDPLLILGDQDGDLFMMPFASERRTLEEICLGVPLRYLNSAPGGTSVTVCLISREIYR